MTVDTASSDPSQNRFIKCEECCLANCRADGKNEGEYLHRRWHDGAYDEWRGSEIGLVQREGNKSAAKLSGSEPLPFLAKGL